jgi:hypothetical protein
MTKEAIGSLTHTFGVATAAPPRVIKTQVFSSKVQTRETDKGTHVIEGLRIFKAGTFADSMGIVRTWETMHLDQMVLHYRLLKDGNILPNVPVREDHSFSVRDVVGYFDTMYRDPEDGNFLACDIEITEPDAFEKWERGTYRSRSLEIGMYETNGDAPQTYWPVVMGLAFVDIGAVEGLFSKESSTHSFSQLSQDEDKETQVDEQQFLAACRYAEWVAAAEYAQKVQDWERACVYAHALEEHQKSAAALGLGTVDHGRANGDGTITFMKDGLPVTMSAQEVGNTMTGLEAFRRETIENGRKTFVDGLVSSHKIAAPQADDMKALVLTMNDPQFEAFKKSYEAAPVASLFGQFGPGGGGDNPDAPSTADEIATYEEIVANHRRTGKSQEDIEKLDSFKKLTALKAHKGQG